MLFFKGLTLGLGPEKEYHEYRCMWRQGREPDTSFAEKQKEGRQATLHVRKEGKEKSAAGDLPLAFLFLPRPSTTTTQTIALYATIVMGRNQVSSPAIAELLPAELCLALISKPEIAKAGLGVCTEAMRLVRCLYVVSALEVEPVTGP